MKALIKILFILIWFLFVGVNKKAETWIIFYENKETREAHKCKREDYIELLEVMELRYEKQFKREYLFSMDKYKDRRKQRKKRMNEQIKQINK